MAHATSRWEETRFIAAVYGPREVHPRHLQDVTRAIVRYRYNMASFSVEERKRPGPDRRSYELSKVSREALEPVILTSFFPRSVIDVFVEVLQADAGTRTAGINAAAVALADAGIPMKNMISSCAAQGGRHHSSRPYERRRQLWPSRLAHCNDP